MGREKNRLLKKISGISDDYLIARLYIEHEIVELDDPYGESWDTRHIQIKKVIVIPERKKSLAFTADGKVLRVHNFRPKVDYVPIELVYYPGYYGRAMIDGRMYFDFVMPKKLYEALIHGHKAKKEIRQLESSIPYFFLFQTLRTETKTYYLGNDK